jgi:hypothetical protein
MKRPIVDVPALPESAKSKIVPNLVVRGHGLAYGIQNSYADWQYGMRRARSARQGLPPLPTKN